MSKTQSAIFAFIVGATAAVGFQSLVSSMPVQEASLIEPVASTTYTALPADLTSLVAFRRY